MKYKVFLNSDNSIFDIRQEDILNKSHIELEYNKVIEVLHLMKSVKENEKVFYIDNKFIIKYDFEKLLNELRKLRNEKIKETDYLFLNDTTELYNIDLINSVKNQRQILRDITNDIDSVEDILIKIKYIKNI